MEQQDNNLAPIDKDDIQLLSKRNQKRFNKLIPQLDQKFKELEIEKLNSYLFYSVIISFIYPVYSSAGNTNIWLTPFPLKLLFEFFSKSFFHIS